MFWGSLLVSCKLLEIEDELNQRANTNASCSFRIDADFLGAERSAGDVQMNPGRTFLDELAEEPGSCDVARVGAIVGQVCHRALVEVAVMLGHRHLPHLLTSTLSSVQKRAGELLVVAEHASDVVAQSFFHGTGEGSQVDDLVDAVLLQVGQRVAERVRRPSASV